MIRTLCLCGCGQTVRGKYKFGHRPDIKSYRVATVNGRADRVHRLRAEAALGRPLPPGAVVHHTDGTKSEASPLVICQNQSYHRLLHGRMDIIRAGGSPETHRICSRCQRMVLKEEAARPIARQIVVSTICKACNRELANANRLEGKAVCDASL
jgi:hypothetical protein